jgi:hypothetical protein
MTMSVGCTRQPTEDGNLTAGTSELKQVVVNAGTWIRMKKVDRWKLQLSGDFASDAV